MRVYSLVSSTKHHSPDFIQLPPGRRTCSFISHLNSPGSIQPGCHFFGATELFKLTSLHCPTRYPLTPGSRECTCEQSALPRSTTSKHIQRSLGSNRRPLACKSRTVPLSHDTSHYMSTEETINGHRNFENTSDQYPTCISYPRLLKGCGNAAVSASPGDSENALSLSSSL